jgi:tetratricopeptide (TPR) repeat protein
MGIFVGRDPELRALDALLDAAVVGEGNVALVSGEPGVGKTRLVEELTRRAEARGFVVAWGRSWEGEGTPAYYPWLQVLRRLRGSFGPLFDLACAESPELAVLLEEVRGAAHRDPAEARFRLFDAVSELVRRAAEERPIAIVLDDLHAADVSTLQMLHFIARHAREGARLHVAGTIRDNSLHAQQEVGQLIARIGREAVALPIGRLRREALVAWVEAVAPDLVSSVDRLLSVSEGNPLFVAELLASVNKRPSRAWLSAGQLPLGVREAIRAHVGSLTEPTQRVLEAASVLGREFRLASLTVLVEDVRTAVAEAVGAGILESFDGVLRFTHILICDELCAALTLERRSQYHRSAAANERDPVLAAPHWLAGGRPEDSNQVFTVVVEALQRENARFAGEDAASLGHRALDAFVFPPRQACELRIAVAEAWVLAGKFSEARQMAALAAEAARELKDGELLSRAALAHATEFIVGTRDATSVTWLRAALAMLVATDSATRSKVMARLAVAMLPSPPKEHEEALSLSREALAMARRLGDDGTLFTTLRFTRTTPSETDDSATRYSLNAETIALATKMGQVPLVAPLYAWQVAACIELGDIDAALRQADEMESQLSAYRQPIYRYRTPLVHAMLADLEGRFAEADALSHEALRISEDNGLDPGLVLFGSLRIGFLYTRGDADSWAEVEPMVLPMYEKDPMLAIYRCMFDAMCDRPDKVRASLAMTKGVPLDALPDVGALGVACAAAKIHEYAQVFYDVVAREEAKGPWQFGPGRVTSVGPRALTLGRLAVLLGRHDDALAHFARARALVARLRSRPYIAQTDLATAEILARREPERARAVAESARTLASEVGMRGVEARAQALLEALAPRAASPAPSPRARPLTAVRSAPRLTLEREGEMWRIDSGARVLLLRDTKGLAYLDVLVREPCREFHVLDLVGLRDDGDAGVVLDARAKHAYRERAESLRESLAEATAHHDLGRAERARAELDALANELSRAVGAGGRDRRSASPAERARINVQRRIRDVLGRVRAEDPSLGEHLDLSLRTGVFCVYLPGWP